MFKHRRANGSCTVVAAAMALGWASLDGAAAQKGIEPQITPEATERFADDLSLSEAQRTLLHGLVEAYQKWHGAAVAESAQEFVIVQRQYFLRVNPELDESYDISHLPSEEQRAIIRSRSMFQRTGLPGRLVPEQIRELSVLSLEHWGEFRTRDLEQRESMLQELQVALAPEQLERWPTAMRRLDINLADQTRRFRVMLDDPQDHPDLLGLLIEATEDDAELHPLADAVRFPDRVLAVEPSDEDRARVAALVLAFENSYQAALRGYRRLCDDLESEHMRLFSDGDFESAARLERRMQNGQRRVWEVRLGLVRDMAGLVHELLGEPASRAWQQRCWARFCPELYQPESTDVLFKKAMAIESLSPEVVAAAEAIYDEHCAAREVDRIRVAKLEIEERWSTLMSDRAADPLDDTEDDRSLRARLTEAHEARREDAAQVNRSLRSLLPAERQAEFDAWYDAWRKEQQGDPNREPDVIRP